MIEYVSITNFQTHSFLDIDLDPHCTVLVGPSDVGKSTVIRAFRWCLLNQVDPDFITWDNDFARVAVGVDGHVVVRKQGKQGNVYKLDDAEYVSFRSNVPEPISNLFNVTEVNFQGQHDSIFWLADTPGQVSKELNQIVNLGVIDSTLSNIADELRASRTVVKVSAERLEKAIAKKEVLAFVPEMMGELDALLIQKGSIEEKARKCTVLANQLQKVKDAKVVLANAGNAAVDAGNAVSAGAKVVDLQVKVQKLFTLLNSLRKQEKELCLVETELCLINGELEKVTECPLCGQTTL